VDIADLIAERAIRMGHYLYARCHDGHDWPGLAEVLAPDVQAFMGGKDEQMTFDGLDAFVANSRKYLEACGQTQHLLGAFEATVNGEAASSRIQARVLHRGRDEHADLFQETFGEYHAEWRRTDAGWRAARWELRTTLYAGTWEIFRLDS
jgi:hypothetical protein